MTMTFKTGGSPTLMALYKNCVTEEQIEEAAARDVNGPYHVGEMTAFVYRPKKDNGRPMQLTYLADSGLAGCSDAASQEVDMTTLGLDEMKERAREWLKAQTRNGHFTLQQKVALVYDGSRAGAAAFRDESEAQKLKATLDEMSRPRESLATRAAAALKRVFTPS